MTLTDFVTLGNSDLKVSPLCLGTMMFGENWGQGENVLESQAALKQYLRMGGNFIDTSNCYTGGRSETIIGNFLRMSHIRRERLVIATKVFGSEYTGDPGTRGASRKSLVAACENSLRRLQTDYIDVYWLHHWDKQTPIQETMSVLNDLVTQGKVRYIGFADSPAWKIVEAQMIAEFRGWAPLIAIQNEYSLLERSVEAELLPMAIELGMGMVSWAPLKLGVLSGRFTRENRQQKEVEIKEWQAAALTERAYRFIDELSAVAQEIGARPGQVALAWVRQRKGVTSSIVMGRDVEQLKAHIASLTVTLEEVHLSRLQAVADSNTLEMNMEPIHSAPQPNVVELCPLAMNPASVAAG
jgi:aryl-alcohol dehydrogenase-like predicted oxidoreductase